LCWKLCESSNAFRNTSTVQRDRTDCRGEIEQKCDDIYISINLFNSNKRIGGGRMHHRTVRTLVMM